MSCTQAVSGAPGNDGCRTVRLACKYLRPAVLHFFQHGLIVAQMAIARARLCQRRGCRTASYGRWFSALFWIAMETGVTTGAAVPTIWVMVPWPATAEPRLATQTLPDLSSARRNGLVSTELP